MKNNIIQSEMDVKGSKINVVRVDGYEYISLTDLAKTQNDEAPADVVKNWLEKQMQLELFLNQVNMVRGTFARSDIAFEFAS